MLMGILAPLFGEIIKSILPALWNIKEKSHEAIEHTVDPDLYDSLAGYDRM